MTKRALAVIAVIILIPILITFRVLMLWRDNNKVIGSYGENGTVVLEGLTLQKVEGSENYVFKTDKYLGKIGHKLFGSQLYSTFGDGVNRYYVLADSERGMLYTATGALYDGIKTENSVITRLIVGYYSAYTEDAGDISEILREKTEVFTFAPEKYENDYKRYTLNVCYDGSCVSTESAGTAVHILSKNLWLYISAEEEARAAAALENGETEKLVYSAVSYEKPSEIRALERLIFGTVADETTAESTAE